MKKIFTIIFLIAFIFMLTGCHQIEGIIEIIDEEQPTFDFGSSTVLIEEDLLAYINEFESEYVSLNTPCSYDSYNTGQPITRDEVKGFYNNPCNSDASIFFTDFDTIKDILDILFNSDETLMTNESIEIDGSTIMIEFNDDVLRVTSYTNSESFFIQYTLATIDSNIYYKYDNYMYASDDQDFYSKCIYYQNHYVIYEYLNPNGTQTYQKNLLSSEILSIRVNFSHVTTSSKYRTTLVIGDEDFTNVVNYYDSKLSFIKTKQLDGDYVEIEYRTDGENVDYLYINALELDDWNLLKQSPYNNREFQMYDNETLLYDDLSIMYYDSAQMPAVLIEQYSTIPSVLTVGKNNFDLHAIILEHDTFEENYLDLMEHYNISVEEKTYEDYVDAFLYIKTYFNEFINE
jgi:hypothetical protein